MIKTLKTLTTATLLAASLAIVSQSAPAFADHHAASQNDIVETAAAAKDFSTLVAAVQAADLVDTLQGDGPFTVFAPTNEAFATLPAGTVETLLKPENKALLTKILTFHVVPGKILSTDLAGKVLTAKTASGEDVRIDATGGEVRVDTAKVIMADIITSNGVIHVIDRVIQPE